MIVRSAVSSFCLAGRSGGRTVRTRQGSYIVFRARSNGGARSRSCRSTQGKGGRMREVPRWPRLVVSWERQLGQVMSACCSRWLYNVNSRKSHIPTCNEALCSCVYMRCRRVNNITDEIRFLGCNLAGAEQGFVT